MRREADTAHHKGIKGWHHHHGWFSAVTFHNQDDYRLMIEEEPNWDGDPEFAYSTHRADHDQLESETDDACRDSACPWLTVPV